MVRGSGSGLRRFQLLTGACIEVRAHDERELWPKSDDPALLHPMSSRLVQILETYKRLYKETGKEQPFLKNAR
jgi:transaldolase